MTGSNKEGVFYFFPTVICRPWTGVGKCATRGSGSTGPCDATHPEDSSRSSTRLRGITGTERRTFAWTWWKGTTLSSSPWWMTEVWPPDAAPTAICAVRNATEWCIRSTSANGGRCRTGWTPRWRAISWRTRILPCPVWCERLCRCRARRVATACIILPWRIRWWLVWRCGRRLRCRRIWVPRCSRWRRWKWVGDGRRSWRIWVTASSGRACWIVWIREGSRRLMPGRVSQYVQCLLIDWLIECSIDCSIDCLIDWFNDLLMYL